MPKTWFSCKKIDWILGSFVIIVTESIPQEFLGRKGGDPFILPSLAKWLSTSNHPIHSSYSEDPSNPAPHLSNRDHFCTQAKVFSVMQGLASTTMAHVRSKSPDQVMSDLSKSSDPMTAFVAAPLGPRSPFFQAIAPSSEVIWTSTPSAEPASPRNSSLLHPTMMDPIPRTMASGI